MSKERTFLGRASVEKKQRRKKQNLVSNNHPLCTHAHKQKGDAKILK